jgi:predicted acyl esterase
MPGISEPIYDVQVEENVPIVMRDGAILRADVYRPLFRQTQLA